MAMLPDTNNKQLQMDYTKTDEQLKNIMDGLREIDPVNNAFVYLRANRTNKEIRSGVSGNPSTVINMIASTMLETEDFKHIIFGAVARFAELSARNRHEDCGKCNEPNCPVRKQEYKGE
jgi:hypothetical protein